jgi:vacuolar-type H+-ATPase subunit I/STV1
MTSLSPLFSVLYSVQTVLDEKKTTIQFVFPFSLLFCLPSLTLMFFFVAFVSALQTQHEELIAQHQVRSFIRLIALSCAHAFLPLLCCCFFLLSPFAERNYDC